MTHCYCRYLYTCATGNSIQYTPSNIHLSAVAKQYIYTGIIVLCITLSTTESALDNKHSHSLLNNDGILNILHRIKITSTWEKFQKRFLEEQVKARKIKLTSSQPRQTAPHVYCNQMDL